MGERSITNPALPSGALQLRVGIASGAISICDLAETLIAQIKTHEPEIGAWAWFDPGFVRDQAKVLDNQRAAGRPLGRLYGLPVGIKDIIDTAQIPTENGSPLDIGRIPSADAFIVARLRQEGALIVGKTTTTELAFMDPAKTRNPRKPAHSPGGSSAGSAAAVAADMVPLAIGTQTAGSVIRPASFCGVVGYKPSFGAIPRTGVLTQSPSLDTIGVFARSVEDAALLAETLFGFDPADPATTDAPIPALLDMCLSDSPVTPKLAFVRQPAWEHADPDTKLTFENLCAGLGDQCVEVELPEIFAEALAGQAIIQKAELAKNYSDYADRGMNQLGPNLQAGIHEGNAILARDYIAARDWPRVLAPQLAQIFDRFDAIITPAAPGTAPEGLGSTGNPAFNSLWTLFGTPAVTIPMLMGRNGLPLGVQLVGRCGDDARLLRIARWLFRQQI